MRLDYQFLFSNAQSLVTSTSVVSTNAIDLSNSRDLGLGDGIQPKIIGTIGTGITAACASATFMVQFQGSTDSSAWTTYIETSASTTASLSASSKAFQFDLPPRPSGAALPRYYRCVYVFGGNLLATTISTGTITTALVLQPQESLGTLGKYPSGYTVVT